MLEPREIQKVFGLTRDQVSRILYKLPHSPKPVGYRPRQGQGGKPFPLYKRSDIQSIIDAIASDKKRPGEYDLGDLACMLRCTRVNAAYVMRTNPGAPKPTRIGKKGAKYYRQADIDKFITTLKRRKGAGNKTPRKQRDLSDLSDIPAPVQNEKFDNAAARSFLSSRRASAHA